MRYYILSSFMYCLDLISCHFPSSISSYSQTHTQLSKSIQVFSKGLCVVSIRPCFMCASFSLSSTLPKNLLLRVSVLLPLSLFTFFEPVVKQREYGRGLLGLLTTTTPCHYTTIVCVCSPLDQTTIKKWYPILLHTLHLHHTEAIHHLLIQNEIIPWFLLPSIFNPSYSQFHYVSCTMSCHAT